MSLTKKKMAKNIPWMCCRCELQELKADVAGVQRMTRRIVWPTAAGNTRSNLRQLYNRYSDVRYDQMFLAQQQKNLQLLQLLKQEQYEAANSCQP